MPNASLYHQYRAEGRCGWCGTPAIGSEAMCRRCRARNRVRCAAGRADRKNRGICLWCANAAVADKTLCAECLIKNKQRNAQRRTARTPTPSTPSTP